MTVKISGCENAGTSTSYCSQCEDFVWFNKTFVLNKDGDYTDYCLYNYRSGNQSIQIKLSKTDNYKGAIWAWCNIYGGGFFYGSDSYAPYTNGPVVRGKTYQNTDTSAKTPRICNVKEGTGQITIY